MSYVDYMVMFLHLWSTDGILLTHLWSSEHFGAYLQGQIINNVLLNKINNLYLTLKCKRHNKY